MEYEKRTEIKSRISAVERLADLKKLHSFSTEDEKSFRAMYNVDPDNDIFFNDQGAIYSSIWFPEDYTEEQKAEWFKNEYRDERYEHSDYNLTLVPGEFPILYSDSSSEDLRITWSNYIVVIANYKQLLEKQSKEKQSIFESAIYGITSQNGGKQSNLPGAIGIDDIFTFLAWGGNGCDYGDFRSVDYGVSDKFEKDSTNGIFFNGNGAVLNAYDFGKLDDIDKERAINMVVNNYQNLYPNYELSLCPGEFPISYMGDNRSDDRFHLSTHVLYVKNYKQCLPEEFEKNPAKK